MTKRTKYRSTNVIDRMNFVLTYYTYCVCTSFSWKLTEIFAMPVYGQQRRGKRSILNFSAVQKFLLFEACFTSRIVDILPSRSLLFSYYSVIFNASYDSIFYAIRG